MQLQFLTDTYQFETEATVTDSGDDDDGSYVVMDHTVFYPGGGGQEPDRGKIIDSASGKSFPVLDAFYAEGEFRHYISRKLPTNAAVKVAINPQYRLHNAQLHTAGHLLSCVVTEKLNSPLHAVKGFHYQQGAYIEFESEEEMVREPSAEVIREAVAEEIRRDLPVHAHRTSSSASGKTILQIDSFHPLQKEPKRWIQIEGYQAIPCGGTHVSRTGEIGKFSIRLIQYKKGRFRISYRTGD